MVKITRRSDKNKNSWEMVEYHYLELKATNTLGPQKIYQKFARCFRRILKSYPRKA